MIIGIGTENRPKIEACKAVIQRLKVKLKITTTPDYIIKKIPSGISDMPLSQEEMMIGAKNRAINLFTILKKEYLSPKFTIGMEGGLFKKFPDSKNDRAIFLQSWVFVYNGDKGSWGSSGAISVPEKVYKPILNNGWELAQVIDSVSGKENVRSHMGAVGVFSDGQILRQDFFESALEFAFAPFYNPAIYTPNESLQK